MRYTIIKVDQTNYQENIIVTESNIAEVQREIEGKEWEYVVKGDFVFDIPFVCWSGEENNTPFKVLIQMKDDKVKVLEDHCEYYTRVRFQNLKETQKGFYINWLGSRLYFFNEINA